MGCCDSLKGDDVSKIQDICSSALHPFITLVCKQVHEGAQGKNVKWGMFVLASSHPRMFPEIPAWQMWPLPQMANEVKTQHSWKKVTHRFSRRWKEGVCEGKCEGGRRGPISPPEQKWSLEGEQHSSKESWGSGQGKGVEGLWAVRLWGWGVWAYSPACCVPVSSLGAWRGTQGTRKAFQPAHHFKKKWGKERHKGKWLETGHTSPFWMDDKFRLPKVAFPFSAEAILVLIVLLFWNGFL